MSSIGGSGPRSGTQPFAHGDPTIKYEDVDSNSFLQLSLTQPVGEMISSNFPHPSTKKEVTLKKLLE